MGKYNLSEVKTKKDIKQWLDFPSKLYKKDPYYVRPLDNEVENVFDRSKNKLFRHGDATRFILKDDKGKIIGRIAAFYDEKTSNTYNKEENGKDTLITNEQVDDKNIKIVLKGGTEKSIKDVEQLIIEVLGDQYIQRNLESLI